MNNIENINKIDFDYKQKLLLLRAKPEDDNNDNNLNIKKIKKNITSKSNKKKYEVVLSEDVTNISQEFNNQDKISDLDLYQLKEENISTPGKIIIKEVCEYIKTPNCKMKIDYDSNEKIKIILPDSELFTNTLPNTSKHNMDNQYFNMHEHNTILSQPLQPIENKLCNTTTNIYKSPNRRNNRKKSILKRSFSRSPLAKIIEEKHDDSEEKCKDDNN